MAFTHEQVAHLNHLVELVPSNTSSDQVIAGFTSTGNVFDTGRLAVTASDFRHSPFSRMLIQPALDSDCNPIYPGASYIDFMGYNTAAPGEYTIQSMKPWWISSRSAGEHVRYATTSDTPDPDMMLWTLVPRYVSINGTMTHGVTIFSGDSTLCVTIGAAPSNAAPVDNADLYLTEYDGSYNQIFVIIPPHCFAGGVYGISPRFFRSADPHATCGPYAHATTPNLPVKMIADSPLSRGQTWRILYRGRLLGATTQRQQTAMFYYPPRRERSNLLETGANVMVTNGVIRDGVTLRQVANENANANPLAEQPARTQPMLTADAGLFEETFTQAGYDDEYGRTDAYFPDYTYSRFSITGASDTSMNGGDLWAAEEVPPMMPATLSSDVTIHTGAPAGAHMTWLPKPRNFYDRSLPVPQMLRFVDADGNEIESGFLSTGESITIYPQAICSENQFLSVVQIRHKSNGEWGNWETLTADNEVTARMTGGALLPYQEDTHAPVWIPNAWLGAPDFEGRRTQTQGYTITGDGSVFQVRAILRSFAYGVSRLATGTEAEPFVGDAAITSITFRPEPLLSITSGTIDEQGWHFPYSISGLTEPMRLHISHLLWESTPAWTASSRNYVPDYDIILNIPTSTIDIPWDAASMLPDNYAALGNQHVRIAGELHTTSGQVPFDRMLMVSCNLQIMGNSIISSTFYQRIEISRDISSAYAQVDNEFGSRVIKLDPMNSRDIFWPTTAEPDFNASRNGYSSVQKIFIFSDMYVTAIQLTKLPSWQHMATLTFIEHGIFDVAHIIPLRGDPSFSTTLTRDSTIMRRWNSDYAEAEVADGTAQDTRMSATVFVNQLSMTGSNIIQNDVMIQQSTRDIASIPADATMILQTQYGATKLVKIVAMDIPRNQRDKADITLTIEEVESL